jgi:iron complex outermembrane receptor protein
MPIVTRIGVLAGTSLWCSVVAHAATTDAPPAATPPIATPPATAASSPTVPPQQVRVEGRNDAAERRQAALGALSVVDREELDRHGDLSVLDVLQRQPGVSVDGEQPRIRGLGAGYTLILINGEPAPPGFSLDQLSPAEVERIDIIKGPSAEFGGVAGTLNIILRAPPRTTQRESRATVTYRTLQPTLSAWGQWGDRQGAWSWSLPLAANRWAGETRTESQRLTRGRAGERRLQRNVSRDPWRGGGINFGPRVDWRPREGQLLQWQAYLQQNETDNRGRFAVEPLEGTPPSVLQSESATRGRTRLGRTQLQWSDRRDSGLRWELKGLAEWSAGESAGRSDALAGTAVPLVRLQSAWNRNARASAGARLRAPWAEGHQAVLGLDGEVRTRREQRDLVENGRALRTDSVGQPFGAELRRLVLFAQDDWTVSDALSLTLGWRQEWLQTEAELRAVSVAGGRSGRQQGHVGGPVLQGRWAPGPRSGAAAGDRGWVWRAGVARTARLPELTTLLDRYALNSTDDRDQANSPLSPDQAGNPALRAEQAWSLELGAERSLPGAGVLSLTLYARQIDDLIRRRIALESVPESPVQRWVSRPVNLGSASARGGAVEWKGPLAGPRSPWIGRASVGVNRSRVAQVDGPDARLEAQPPWSLTLGLDRQTRDRPEGGWPRGLGAGASFTYTPAYATQQTDLQQVWRDAVPRLDLYLSWRPDPALQFRLSLQNAVPADQHTRSEVRDIDGFTATGEQWRETLRTLQASVLVRF